MEYVFAKRFLWELTEDWDNPKNPFWLTFWWFLFLYRWVTYGHLGGPTLVSWSQNSPEFWTRTHTCNFHWAQQLIKLALEINNKCICLYLNKVVSWCAYSGPHMSKGVLWQESKHSQANHFLKIYLFRQLLCHSVQFNYDQKLYIVSYQYKYLSLSTSQLPKIFDECLSFVHTDIKQVLFLSLYIVGNVTLSSI